MHFEGAGTALSVCTRYAICLCLCPSQHGNKKAVRINTMAFWSNSETLQTHSDNIILSSGPGRKKKLRSC